MPECTTCGKTSSDARQPTSDGRRAGDCRVVWNPTATAGSADSQ